MEWWDSIPPTRKHKVETIFETTIRVQSEQIENA